MHVDDRCTTQCLRGNVAECVCHPPIDGHYQRGMTPETCVRTIAATLANEALEAARRIRHAG